MAATNVQAFSGDLDIAGAITSNLEVGTANLFVDTVSSNVGIGTTTPGQKLSVYTGSTNDAALSFDRFSSGNYRTDIYQNTYGPDFRVGYSEYTPSSVLYLKRFSDGSKELEINGNVGIGTDDPGKKIEISHGYQDLGGWIDTYRVPGVAGGMQLGTRQGGGAYVDSLFINDSGYVGIAKNNPAFTFDVQNSSVNPICVMRIIGPSGTGIRFRMGTGGGSNSYKATGINLSGGSGGGGILICVTSNNSAQDRSVASLYFIRKAYDQAYWPANSNSIRELASLSGGYADPTVEFRRNNSILEYRIPSGGNVAFYALEFDS